jgi:hypothetical protein
MFRLLHRLLVLSLVHALPAPLVAADAPGQPTPDLDLLARASVPLVSLRFADVIGSDFWKAQSDETRKQFAQARTDWEKFSGVPAENVERTVVLFDAFIFHSWVLVRTVRPPDREQVLKALAPRSREMRYSGRVVQVNEDTGDALCFLDERTFASGRSEGLENALKGLAAGNKARPLAEAATLAERHHLVIAVPQKFSLGGLFNQTEQTSLKEQAKKLPAEWKPVLPLADARLMTFALNLGSEATAELTFHFANEAGARAAEKAAKALPGLVADQLAVVLEKLLSAPPLSDKQKLALKPFQAALRATEVRLDGSALRSRATLKNAPAAVAALLAVPSGS